MNKKLFTSTVIGFIFTALTGTLLHYAYAYSNHNILIGFLTPVNESVFEHLKLLFFPQLLFSIFEYLWIGKRYKNFIFIKASACLTGLLFIPLLHYTSVAITKANVLWIDVTIFYLSTLITFVSSCTLLLKNHLKRYDWNAYGLFLYAFIILIFVLCTIYPPQLNLFARP